MGEFRQCWWCEKYNIPASARRDKVTCSQECRQAKQRFCKRVKVGPDLPATSEPMHFCYFDPPYPGLAKRVYGDHRDFDGEVDHAALVAGAVRDYPDGWALSTSAAATRDVWSLCPIGTRLFIWVNGPRRTESYEPLHAYESVLVYGGRPRKEPINDPLCDVLQFGGRQHTHPGALPGMKPAAFCNWLFEILGASRGDRLDDPFHGSGAVKRAWSLYTGEAK